MALFHVYTYKLELTDPRVKTYLSKSSSIRVVDNAVGIYNCVYEDHLLVPRVFFVSFNGELPSALSVEDLARKTSSIEVSSSEEFKDLELLRDYTYFDYPKTIDDLVARGKVFTAPSSSVLATDPRKFKFAGEDQEYEVDCLGTKMFVELTERVVEAWKSK